MRQTFHNKIVRKSYGKLKEVLEISNLIEIQLNSYESFLQKDIPPEERTNVGLQAVFNSVFPIKDSHDTTSLEFVKYEISDPKYSEEECIVQGTHFRLPHEGHHTARRLQHRSEHEDKRHQGSQGTGRLLRRDPPHDGEGDVHHQRDRKGHRQPASSVARASTSTATSQKRPSAAISPTRHGLSPTGAPGSISSSTTKNSSMFA